eukprot:14434060-Heterocapsa_arctica.AAC.1
MLRNVQMQSRHYKNVNLEKERSYTGVRHHRSVYIMPHSHVPSRNGVIEVVETVRNNTTMIMDSRGPPKGRTHRAMEATGVQPLL